MRALTDSEMGRTLGGDDGDIIVVGTPYDSPDVWFWSPFDPIMNFNFGGGTAPIAPSPAPLNQNMTGGTHRIDLSHLTHTLTSDEQHALNDFAAALARNDAQVGRLQVHIGEQLSDGSVVSSNEIKSLFSQLNFIVNEAGTTYGNATDRGQASYPNVEFNLDTIVAYDKLSGGLDFLALHELGHITAEAQNNYQGAAADGTITAAEMKTQEVMANDIARAILQYSGATVYNEQVYGYSPNQQSWQPDPPFNNHGIPVEGGHFA